MPLPVIADCFRVAVDWQDVSGTSPLSATNVMHILGPGATALQVLLALNSEAVPDMFDSQCLSTQASQFTVLPLDGSSVAAVGNPNALWKGNRSSTPLPSTAALLKLTTAKRGRSYRGRLFLPFVAESRADGGLLPAALSQTAAWVLFSNNLHAYAPLLSLAVASYRHATAEAVTNLAVELALATQRRRQSRVRTALGL
jgi:hypothetical protein